MDNINADEVKPVEQEMIVRRLGDKVVTAWRTVEKLGSGIDIKKLLEESGIPLADKFTDFTGNRIVVAVNNQTGQQQAMPMQFPINNCASFEEAFGAFDEAAALHMKLLTAQSQMVDNQRIAQQRAMQNRRAIENAVGGIVLAR